MKLAFYYHIPIAEQNGILLLPSFFGVFIDSLASNVETLFIIMHQANDREVSDCNYQLNSNNITWVNLGLKTPAWHRELFHRAVLKVAMKSIECCDVLVVRSPTPLAPYFHKYVKKNKVWFMIVGDYLEAIDHYKNSGFRNKLVYLYLHINDFFFQRRIRKTNILVNSPALFNKYRNKAKSIFQIRTTTLTDSDFYIRDKNYLNQQVELLYTGQFNPSKGLFELIDALSSLVKEHLSVRLHLVGWEDDVKKTVENALKERALKLGVANHLIFHGKKSVGLELNKMYRLANIYILPSYHEGFPRTIWEAMANGLPVVATNVGGIPKILEHGKNVYLIEPKKSDEITSAVKELIKNNLLRETLIKEGFLLARENTLEIQTKKLVDILKSNSQK